MNPTLPAFDFTTLSTIPPNDIRQVTVLREKEAHRVYRLECETGSYILKVFNASGPALELKIYSLLSQLGVPTLPVYEQTGRAILLEDLQTSPNWRLASESDLKQVETGLALAAWYHDLHRAGREVLNAPPAWLRPWVDTITGSTLQQTGEVLKIQDRPAWKLALECCETLKARYLAFPQTFNYSDFAAENLALSLDKKSPLRAVVFDYDCFSTGTVYSDWRNVTSSLRGAALAAFTEAYGPVSVEERILDDALATLEGLIIASQRQKFPQWAKPLLKAVSNGELEQAIHRANATVNQSNFKEGSQYS